MTQLYLLINLAIIVGPIALSFDKRVGFFRSWKSLAVSLLVVGIGYIVWDVVVARLGHWSFNPEYTGTFRIAGLPIGEILFFISVPYACIFLYEVVRSYFRERTANRVGRVRLVALLVAAIFAILSLVFRGEGYTALVMASVAAMLVLTVVFDPSMWMSTHTLIFYLLSFLLFLVANGILTALPIVEYGPEAIQGIRVYTIPIEDFFYNFGMLGFYLFFYRLAGRREPASRHGSNGERP